MQVGILMPNAEHFRAGLQALGPKVTKKLVGAALRAGGKIITAEFKARSPVGKEDKGGKYPHKKGDMRRSVRLRIGKTRNAAEQKAIVIVGAGSGKWHNIYYPFFVMFGHRIGKRTSAEMTLQKKKSQAKARGDDRSAAAFQAEHDRISQRRFVPGRKFMLQAFDHKKDEAQQAIGVTLGQGIENEWRRLMQ